MATDNEAQSDPGIILRCPECGYTGDIDTFDVLGADEDKLFCNQCMAHAVMESVE